MYFTENGGPFFNTLKFQKFFLLYNPFSSKTQRSKFIYFLIASLIVRIVFTVFTAVSCIIHWIMLSREKLDVDTTEDLSLIIGGLGATILCTVYPFVSEKWSSIFSEVTKYTTFGKPPQTDQTVTFLNKFSNFFCSYYMLGTVLYGIVGIYDAQTCLKLKDQHISNRICITMFPIWLPFEISIPSQLIMFVAQLITVTFSSTGGGLTSYLTWEVTQMIILHIRFLKKLFHDVIEERNKDKRRKMLGLWVFYHQFILKLVNHLNYLTKICVGIDTLIGAVVCACIANQAVNLSKPVGAMLHLGGWMGPLFLLCDAGQKIQDETVSIGDAISSSNWYKTDLQTKKDIVFILRRCQKPLTLDALPLGSLHYALLLYITKTSYSYLTLLMKTTK